MKKNILIVIDSLAMGGVTKVLANMLNTIDYSKYNIDLKILHYYNDMRITLPKEVNIIKGTRFFNVVDRRIKDIIKQKDIINCVKKLYLVFLIKTGLIKNKIIKERKETLKKQYDIEISFNDGFGQVYVAYGDTNKRITWLHSDIRVKNYSKRYYKTLNKLMKNFDFGVSVSDEVGISYKELYNLNCITIHNIIDYEEIIRKAKMQLDLPYDKNKFNIISVGRLDDQKNYIRLISAHKKLIDKGHDINTYIVGDGPNKDNLEKLIQDFDIQKSFFLLGRKDNPYPFIQNADLFALSSNHEGMPTVISEAIILKVPSISTKVAGVQKQLQDKYGMVTENDDNAFYEGLELLLSNKDIIEKYKDNLNRHNFSNKQNLEKIYSILDE